MVYVSTGMGNVQCTTRVSDGFAARANRPKPLFQSCLKLLFIFYHLGHPEILIVKLFLFMPYG